MTTNDTDVRRVLVVGVGGLGVPALIGLGRSGRKLVVGLLDPEKIELSNLARQVIFRTTDVGESKVTAAARWLVEEFSNLLVETMPFSLETGNAREIIDEYDFVIDGTDDPATKFLINDTCICAHRPFVYGGVLGFSGQAMTVVPGRSACLRCLFETAPEAADTASCRDGGVLGPVAGAIGAIQAREALDFIETGTASLVGGMLVYEARTTSRMRVVEISVRPTCSCGAAKAHQLIESGKEL